MRKLALATSASLSVDDARDRIEADMAVEFGCFFFYMLAFISPLRPVTGG